MDSITLNNLPKHNRGISCSVTSCAYHDGVNYCTAGRVAVGPATATNSTQTVCATYKPRRKG